MTIFEEADQKLLPDFKRQPVEIDGKKIMVLSAGSGPALLMLHGDPQTHLCWHYLAPKLTDRFTVVLTDLRGRGESHKPDYLGDQNAYSKRESAAEQLAVMRKLGHETFSVVAHDRGARVARRMALDHSDAVTRLVVMDIIPALDFYEELNADIAQDYFYFSFLSQDRPVPEKLVAGDPKNFMRGMLLGLSDRPVEYDSLALSCYLKSSSTVGAVRAMCECFRAGWHIDRIHDAADREASKKIICPTLVMWGERGVVGKHFDVKRVWKKWCVHPIFEPMPSGHFIPEEAPNACFAALERFFDSTS